MSNTFASTFTFGLNWLVIGRAWNRYRKKLRIGTFFVVFSNVPKPWFRGWFRYDVNEISTFFKTFPFVIIDRFSFSCHKHWSRSGFLLLTKYSRDHYKQFFYSHNFICGKTPVKTRHVLFYSHILRRMLRY